MTIPEQINQIYNECSFDNWDECGAQKISKITARRAIAFWEMLSVNNLSDPKVEAIADGSINFEWHLGARRVLNVSVDEEFNASISYMWNNCRGYGYENIKLLPSCFLKNLIQFYGTK